MKVFISQPMNGLSESEIRTTRDSCEKAIMNNFADVEIIDSYISDRIIRQEDGVSIPIQYLGHSILLLAEAQLAVFIDGYQEARGCQIEYMVCEKYDIPTLRFIDGMLI